MVTSGPSDLSAVKAEITAERLPRAPFSAATDAILVPLEAVSIDPYGGWTVAGAHRPPPLFPIAGYGAIERQRLASIDPQLRRRLPGFIASAPWQSTAERGTDLI
jgi:hypothetical protein